MGYQSFPNSPGASDSAGKLASLMLPPLAGKSFLDVGCGEGFYCGYASFDAASRVVGVDKNEESIKRAKNRFPWCDFRAGDWARLHEILKDNEKFDVILLSSAIHYAEDQTALLASLMERLKPDGSLILEIGVIENPEAIEARFVSPGWFEARSSIDSPIFPDRKGAEELLKPYVYKYMGKSVGQIGDPVPRHVYHIKRARPLAILLTGSPSSGKTTLAKKLAPAIKALSGDHLICEMASTADKSEPIANILGNINYQRIDLAVARLCEAGGLPALAKAAVSAAGGDDFIYDGFIPKEYFSIFANCLANEGCRVLRLETPEPSLSPHDLSKRAKVETKKYQMFLNALEAARKNYRVS